MRALPLGINMDFGVTIQNVIERRFECDCLIPICQPKAEPVQLWQTFTAIDGTYAVSTHSVLLGI